VELVQVNQEIYESTKRLREGSKNLFPLARIKAEAERDYRKALAIEIMRLRDEGRPATLISDIARGNLSDIKFKRDLAEIRYQAARDSLIAIREQMSGLQTIVKHLSEV